MTGVLGVGLALAGMTDPGDLLDPPSPAPAPVVPAERIAGKGLRYRDRATQLALVAAHDALADAGLCRAGRLTVAAEQVAVLASSNFGNLDTVCSVADTLATGGVTETSPMDLPNASSNVVASSVAIRHGLTGPNLMVCNGATSGLDALHWAEVLIAVGRVEYALVIGVETSNAQVAALCGGTALLDGAGAVVLARSGGELRLDRHVRADALASCAAELTAGTAIGAWFVPEGFAGPPPSAELSGARTYDLAGSVGRASGALGVLQCAAAVGLARRGATAPILLTNAGTDGATGWSATPERRS